MNMMMLGHWESLLLILIAHTLVITFSIWSSAKITGSGKGVEGGSPLTSNSENKPYMYKIL